MGDIKRARKKYQTPAHPWQKARMEEERVLMKEFALKNKRELWKMYSQARKIARQTKKLLALKGNPQAEKEKELLIKKLIRYNLIGAGQPIDAALALSYRDILERRLQTIVFRKALAKSMKQARQFITHGHIKVGDKVVTSPSYLVSVDEEPTVSFSEISSLYSEDHPERFQLKKEIKEEKKKLLKEGETLELEEKETQNEI